MLFLYIVKSPLTMIQLHLLRLTTQTLIIKLRKEWWSYLPPKLKKSYIRTERLCALQSWPSYTCNKMHDSLFFEGWDCNRRIQVNLSNTIQAIDSSGSVRSSLNWFIIFLPSYHMQEQDEPNHMEYGNTTNSDAFAFIFLLVIQVIKK